MKKIIKITMLLCVLFVSTKVLAAETEIKSLNFSFDSSWSTFNVWGIIDNDAELKSTFSNAGYETYFKVNDNEISLTSFSNNSEVSNNDLTLKMSGRNDTDKNVIITYTIKNNSEETKTYSIASLSDVQLGDNDNAAIQKIGTSSFKITQDNDSKIGYGAQFGIDLSPAATTTYIGPYDDENYKNYRYTNGDVLYYTKADGVDTTLTYSWTNTINPGETQTLTTTFYIEKKVERTVKFYSYGNYNTPSSTKVILEGGAFETPAVNSEEGYNYKWYANKNGTGTSYVGSTWVIAEDSSTEFYEVKKKNGVVVEPPEEVLEENFLDVIIINDENLLDEVLEEAEQSYDDIKMYVKTEDIDEELDDETEKLINEALGDDYVIGNYFNAELYKKVDDNDPIKITETENLITVSIKVPEELLNDKENIKRIYRVVSLDDENIDVLDAVYDETEKTITFKTNKFSTWVIAYTDEEIINVENPKTNDNILFIMLLEALSLVSIILSVKKAKYNN